MKFVIALFMTITMTLTLTSNAYATPSKNPVIEICELSESKYSTFIAGMATGAFTAGSVTIAGIGISAGAWAIATGVTAGGAFIVLDPTFITAIVAAGVIAGGYAGVKIYCFSKGY